MPRSITENALSAVNQQGRLGNKNPQRLNAKYPKFIYELDKDIVRTRERLRDYVLNRSRQTSSLLITRSVETPVVLAVNFAC